VQQELGGADILVNNAGVMLTAPFASDQREEHRRMVETNLLGAMTATEVFLDHSPAFQGAYVHLAEACARLVSSGRVGQQEPEALAAQLWSFVHGCITLELAEHFVEFDDAVAQVLLPLGVNVAVGLGDERERAQASHEAGVRLDDSITRS
jgi:NAD(P)-dependent dehydrogenase (short-subunit alcohol dehydrogenase family)